MPVRFVYVACATCGAEVDRVEFDAGAAAPAVQDVANALKISAKEAAALVEAKNPGAQLSSEDNARALAESIADKSVDGRLKGTYQCPNGHKDGLTVTETSPTPSIVAAVERSAT